MFRAPCAHHQEVEVALHRLWYHHIYRCDDIICDHQEVKIALHSLWYHHNYRCDDIICDHQEVKTALHSLWYDITWYHQTYRCVDICDHMWSSGGQNCITQLLIWYHIYHHNYRCDDIICDHQEVKTALHSLWYDITWYHHTYRCDDICDHMWSSGGQIALHSFWYHHTYRCDDIRGCVMQFWPPDDWSMK